MCAKDFITQKLRNNIRMRNDKLELIILKCKFLQSNFSVPLNVQNKHKRNRDTEDGRGEKIEAEDAKRSKETEFDGSRNGT